MMISKQQLGSFEVLDELTLPKSDRQVARLDYTTDPQYFIDFETAWGCQKNILVEHVVRLEKGNDNSFANGMTSMSVPSGCDTIIMLQHNPVYTLGTGSDENFVHADSKEMKADGIPKIPVIRMDRGGEVTYHGPGQLTVYPLLDLRSYKQDIHWYMRALEEAIITALSKCGLQQPPERQEDVTGVWVDNHKVAAVGIKCRKWITMHGLAVNVEEKSLSGFDGIVPCGLENRKVGCINQFVDSPMTVREFAVIMKEALKEVFQIEYIEVM